MLVRLVCPLCVCAGLLRCKHVTYDHSQPREPVSVSLHWTQNPSWALATAQQDAASRAAMFSVQYRKCHNAWARGLVRCHGGHPAGSVKAEEAGFTFFVGFSCENTTRRNGGNKKRRQKIYWIQPSASPIPHSSRTWSSGSSHCFWPQSSSSVATCYNAMQLRLHLCPPKVTQTHVTKRLTGKRVYLKSNSTIART